MNLPFTVAQFYPVSRGYNAAVWPAQFFLIAFALVAFSLVVYPLVSILAGHPWPDPPTFGLPCPTTLFTIGVLTLLADPYPKSVLVVPVLWPLVGAQAAFLLDVRQDLSLLVSAAVGLWLMMQRQALCDAASRSAGAQDR